MACTCIATRLEKRRPLTVDAIVPEPIFASTHAITIDAPLATASSWKRDICEAFSVAVTAVSAAARNER